MKNLKPRVHSSGIRPVIFLLAAILFSTATWAEDEICASCGQQVSVSGNFSHHKDRPAVAIEGAGDNAAAFREDINGTNFTVTISHLPPGKYTITVNAAETVASAGGRTNV